MLLSARAAWCAALMGEPDQLHPGGGRRRSSRSYGCIIAGLGVNPSACLCSRENYIPEEHEDLGEDGGDWGQTDRGGDVHGNSLNRDYY